MAKDLKGDFRKSEIQSVNNSDEAKRHKSGMRAIVTRDLEVAVKRGKTYNKDYEDEFQKNVRDKEINSEAIKSHKAYEMVTPKEVKSMVDSDPKGYAKEVEDRRKGKYVPWSD